MNAIEARSLIEFEEYCESRFPVGQSTDRHTSVTGENYREFSGSPGERMTRYQTVELALQGAKSTFDEYASTRTGVLYWRVRPEVERMRDGHWAFYMRLLISSKPRTDQ